jgi:hypothetical protein
MRSTAHELTWLSRPLNRNPPGYASTSPRTDEPTRRWSLGLTGALVVEGNGFVGTFVAGVVASDQSIGERN